MTSDRPGTGLYPWLAASWQALDAHLVAGRVPQGLLVHGPRGVGKHLLVETYAQKLLCRQPAQFACGECSACHLFLAGNHPDCLRVRPVEPGKGIPVDAVRQLCADLALKSQYSGFRVVIITPADLLNLHAANALLKTLEEPAERTSIVLVTEHHAQLPATLLSRCQRLAIPLPGREEALRWLTSERPGCDGEVLLAAAGGSPLRALALASADGGGPERRSELIAALQSVAEHQTEPTSVAERWHKEAELDVMIGWWSSMTADLLRLALAGPEVELHNPDLRPRLQSLSGRLDLVSLGECWDRLLQANRALGTNINRQLLLEELLISWAELGQPAMSMRKGS